MCVVLFLSLLVIGVSALSVWFGVFMVADAVLCLSSSSSSSIVM